ncbi:coat protein [Bromus catharticus striate mosaic virus]|uniref:Capsid protein n=1 Tax=Bromus catharticus striate mosaic virus TaxID=936005 RepID=E7D4Y1_9GEMI|nr:coat protein [Bromus catharticus striate mosaic virus]ADT91303.1 coat protein [Bromus catharticus striate mosaic virus]
MTSSSKRKRGSGKTKTRKKARYTKWTSSRTTSAADSLQVQTFLWAEDQSFNTGGGCRLLTSFTRGSGENQRKSQETITYKVAVNLGISASTTVQKYCLTSHPICWLVYDKTPGIADLTPTDIFDVPTGLNNWPSTWKVKREASHRFVVKRRWPFRLSVNGSTFSADYTKLPVPNTDNLCTINRFAKGLGVRTEWKDTVSADASDIKGGALYIVLAPANGLVFTARGVIKVYFKSVGNQ